MVNRVIGVLLFLFFLCFYLLIPWQISAQGVPPRSPAPVFPQFFPRIIAIFGSLLSLALFMKSFFASASSGGALDLPKANNLLRVLGIVLIMCFYIVTLGPLGYLVSTVISLILLMVSYGLREIKYFIFVIVILPPAVYVLFKKLLYVPLPVGVLGF